MSRTSSRTVLATIALLIAGLCFLSASSVVTAQVSTPSAGEEDALYIDPQNRFAIPIPTNWIAEEHDGYVAVRTDDKKVTISLVVIPTASASEAIVQAMKIIYPDSDATPLPDLMATPTSGGDDVALYTYDDGSASGNLLQAYGQRVDNVVFVLVLDGDLEAVGLRQVQVDKVRFGIQVNPDAIASPVASPAA